MPNDIDLTLQHMSHEDEEKEAAAQARAFHLPYVDLNLYPIEPKVLMLIPADQAHQHQIVAYLRDHDNVVKLATHSEPSEALEDFIQNLSNATHEEFGLNYCSESSIRYALALYQTLAPEKPVDETVQVTQELEQSFETEIKNLADLQTKISQIPTSKVLDVIFAGAIKNEASDIHLEPEENNVRIRFRIDGVLQDVTDLPRPVMKQIIARIKYLAKLKLDITHPQDGRFSINVLGDEVDVRVATLPAAYGEAIVMRILPKNKASVTLEKLGFRPDALEAIKSAISKPQGMILNTGPTGSGKTTTLYAILQQLNSPERKIITMENPIEYRIDGVEQIQIDPENKTGFLDVLKGSLRQNPDVLMIGEIRDTQTADIALQAAMTGHLVLATLHTNDAASAYARLAEIGVEAYLMAGTINLIIAQRLVRRICTACGGKKCEACRQTGYKGRVALVEVLVPTPEIEALIQRKAPVREFAELAKAQGMKTMYQDGLEKVAQGITTKEEVERVTKE